MTLDSIKLSSALGCYWCLCCACLLWIDKVDEGAGDGWRTPGATSDAVLLPLPSFRWSTRSAGAGPRGMWAGGRSTRSVGAGPQSLWRGRSTRSAGAGPTRSVGAGPQSLWRPIHEVRWGRSTRSAGDRSTNSVRAGPLLV